MQNDFDFKEIEELKKIGDILKIKFIPEFILLKLYSINFLYIEMT